MDTTILYMSNRLEKGPKAKDIDAQTDRQTHTERGVTLETLWSVLENKGEESIETG